MSQVKPQQSAQVRVRLGELLVKAGVITDIQLKTALAEQKQWGGKLGDILVRMRYVSEDVFVRALSKQLGIPRADLNQPIAPEAVTKIPAEVAEEYEIVPIAVLDEGKSLAVATADPLNISIVDYVRSMTGLRIVAHVAGASAIRAAISRLYQGEELRDERQQGMQIISNSDDRAPDGPGQFARPETVPPPQGGLTPQQMQQMQQMQQYQQLQQQMQQPPNTMAQPQYGTPAYGIPQPMSQMQQIPSASMQPLPYAALGGQGPDRFTSIEEMQRRDIAALKALVELLVQKGVISLDDYLARLKR